MMRRDFHTMCEKSVFMRFRTGFPHSNRDKGSLSICTKDWPIRIVYLSVIGKSRLVNNEENVRHVRFRERLTAV